MRVVAVERILADAGFVKGFRGDDGFFIISLEGQIQVWHYPDVSQKMLKAYEKVLQGKCTVQRLRTHLLVS